MQAMYTMHRCHDCKKPQAYSLHSNQDYWPACTKLYNRYTNGDCCVSLISAGARCGGFRHRDEILVEEKREEKASELVRVAHAAAPINHAVAIQCIGIQHRQEINPPTAVSFGGRMKYHFEWREWSTKYSAHGSRWELYFLSNLYFSLSPSPTPKESLCLCASISLSFIQPVITSHSVC